MKMSEDKTKFCPYCGTQIDYKYTVCPSCGKPQPAIEGIVVVRSKPKKNPLLALILSLVLTGAGQIYLGRILRGLLFLGSVLLIVFVYNAEMTLIPGLAPTANYNNTIATTDGATVTFTGTVTNFPIKPGTFNPSVGKHTVVLETMADFGNGVLNNTAGGVGTIDYATGNYNITFYNTAPANDVVYITYTYYTDDFLVVIGLFFSVISAWDAYRLALKINRS
jgi:TM2 domain-containing membrane protein YozV